MSRRLALVSLVAALALGTATACGPSSANDAAADCVSSSSAGTVTTVSMTVDATTDQVTAVRQVLQNLKYCFTFKDKDDQSPASFQVVVASPDDVTALDNALPTAGVGSVVTRAPAAQASA